MDIATMTRQSESSLRATAESPQDLGPVVRDAGFMAATPCARQGFVLIYNHMVVGLLTDERANRVFHALADSTRRDIVVRTLQGEHSVSALARHYPMSFAAVQKHVAVLEEAGLVTKHRMGREKIVRGDVETIRRANQLLDDLETVWRGRVERMGELLANDPNGDTR
ncbi:MAG: metalloregulator ArsR/SmtB family transcription factor [Acidimicrobiales bacterium]